MFGLTDVTKDQNLVVIVHHHCRSPDTARKILEKAFAEHPEWQELVKNHVWDKHPHVHRVYFTLGKFGLSCKGSIEVNRRDVIYQLKVPALALAAVPLLTFLPIGKNNLEEIIEEAIQQLFLAAKDS